MPTNAASTVPVVNTNLPSSNIRCQEARLAPVAHISCRYTLQTTPRRPLTHEAELMVAPVMESPKTPHKQSIKKPLAYKSTSKEITPQDIRYQVAYPSKRLRKKSTAAPTKKETAPRKRRRVASDPNAPPPRRSARIAEKTVAKAKK
ncbi:hypothetical protein D9619_008648 [Psilocybe cf. subviscida]|uniref:Uncharacterized protein n=1 Tax=Psilocybe cf. subviscida TaxID=2480587 RepID=A0A8H5BAI9_9AGAR|nr:hypothetical protein D9619_008648 [Psilocybe cf. subviscida]